MMEDEDVYVKSIRAKIKPGDVGAIKDVIEADIQRRLGGIARALVVDAAQFKNFMGFTGHTQTSYTGGIYHDGNLRSSVNEMYVGPYKSRPVSSKVQRGVTKFLSNPYEGEKRAVTGAVDIVGNLSGKSLAMEFLKSHNPGGTGITITTGTEYSELIEKRGDDVLSGSLSVSQNTIEDALRRQKKL